MTYVKQKNQTFLKYLPKKLFVIGNGKLNYERHIILSLFSTKSRLISAYFSTFCASVNDNKSLLGVRLGAYRLKLTSTRICSITGVYIHVERPQAVRTMISGGVAKGRHFPSTVNAHE